MPNTIRGFCLGERHEPQANQEKHGGVRSLACNPKPPRIVELPFPIRRPPTIQFALPIATVVHAKKPRACTLKPKDYTGEQIEVEESQPELQKPKTPKGKATPTGAKSKNTTPGEKDVGDPDSEEPEQENRQPAEEHSSDKIDKLFALVGEVVKLVKTNNSSPANIDQLNAFVSANSTVPNNSHIPAKSHTPNYALMHYHNMIQIIEMDRNRQMTRDSFYTQAMVAFYHMVIVFEMRVVVSVSCGLWGSSSSGGVTPTNTASRSSTSFTM
eukprot:g55624.t1